MAKHSAIYKLSGFILILFWNFSALPAFAGKFAVFSIDTTTQNVTTDKEIVSPTEKDSVNLTKKDSLQPAQKKSPNALTDKVDYKAEDSIVFDLKTKQVYLYKKAKLHYQDIELEADSVTINFDTRILNANGRPDSNGTMEGLPVFTEKGQKYRSKEITYNFNTKKGIINEVIMQEGEGYLHGYKVKKASDEVMYLSGGCFTTCDLDHPHYGLEFTKSKLIVGDRIITGPAYLTIEDMPTPLVVPFAFFPFTKKRSSGILIPSYGYASNRGYYLNNGGYYFAINDYVDLALKGDIYTNLSWALEGISNYYKRYKYRGALDIRYEINKQGIYGTDTYQELPNFSVHWNHEQDPKANPKSRFSAKVDFMSPLANKWSNNSSDYFTNTTNSSISYTRNIGKAFNSFTISLGESYNTNTREYNFDLPTFSTSTKQFFPFRKKKSTGNYAWYEDITIKYSLNAKNNIRSADSTLFSSDIWKKMNAGIVQSVPISSSIRVLKFLNWDNSATYNERWYPNSIRKNWDADSNKVITDTIWGFASNRDITLTSALNTKIYGMANFKGNAYIKAFRHVLTPSVSISYRPDFGNPDFGFWKSYQDSAGRNYDYSVFERSIYGGPPQGKMGALNFSLSNNLEMKVRSKKDTVTGTKKVMLIENLTVSMSYDFAKDSINLSPLRVSGRTTLFKNLSIIYAGQFSPYYIDTLGVTHNQFLWNRDKKLLRMDNSQWDFTLNWHLSSKKKEAKTQAQKDSAGIIYYSPFNNPNEILGNFVDFDIPWNLNIGYTLSYLDRYVAKSMGYENSVVQTLNVSGDFNLTPKWKIGFTTGYDFEQKAIAYTSIDIYRDLHCWEMRFNWIPFGFRKGWNFTIAVKANMLKDLKYEMKSSFKNTQNYN